MAAMQQCSAKLAWGKGAAKGLRSPAQCFRAFAPASTVAPRSVPAAAAVAGRPCLSGSMTAASSSAARRPDCRTNAVARPSVFLFGFGGGDDDDEQYTVTKLQIGMFGDIKKWQKEFERLSELFDTEDEESLHFILQEVVTKLLRNMEYCSYAATAGKVFEDLDTAERKFNEVSMDERAKFKEETYVNVDGRRRTRKMEESTTRDNGLDNWLVVTLVVAAEGKLVLPKVKSLPELRKALTTLGSVTPETVLAFELLWTPQADGDSYSKDEMVTDFPALAIL